MTKIPVTNRENDYRLEVECSELDTVLDLKKLIVESSNNRIRKLNTTKEKLGDVVILNTSEFSLYSKDDIVLEDSVFVESLGESVELTIHFDDDVAFSEINTSTEVCPNDDQIHFNGDNLENISENVAIADIFETTNFQSLKENDEILVKKSENENKEKSVLNEQTPCINFEHKKSTNENKEHEETTNKEIFNQRVSAKHENMQKNENIPVVRVKTEHGYELVKKSEIFQMNGKSYLIKSRRKKITWANFVELLKSMMVRTILIQSLILALILLTNNYFLFFIIILIKLLKFSSHIFVNLNKDEKIDNKFYKMTVMFFASLLFIDHSDLYRDT